MLVVAAVLRVGAIAVYGDATQPQLYEYGGIARHLLSGQGYAHVFPILHPVYGIAQRTWDDAFPTAFTMPGYVLVMTAVLGTLGDGPPAYLTLYALNVIVALLSLLLLQRLVALLLSPSVARIALLLAAVFPPFVAATATFGGTVWVHMVMLWALVFIVRASGRENNALKGRHVIARAFRPGQARPPNRPPSAVLDPPGNNRSADQPPVIIPFLLSGAVSGLWVLFRGEALGAAVLITIWLWRRNGGTLRNAAVYLAACLLVVLPWSVRHTVVFDQVQPLTTNFWLNAWRGNNPETTGGAFKSGGGSNWLTPEIEREIRLLPPSRDYELRVMKIYRERTIAFVRDNPGRTLQLFVKKVGMFMTVDWSDARARHPLFLWPQLLLMAAAVAGAVRLFRRRRFPWPLAAVVLVTMLSVAALHVETRYVLHMGILYIVFAAAAVEAVVARFLQRGASA